MSLFGYPAVIVHKQAKKDVWQRVVFFDDAKRSAKVVEEQKLVRNAQGEEIQTAYQIHLEGNVAVSYQDLFVYKQHTDDEIKIRPLHIEKRKNLGTDIVKKVIVYG